MSIPRRSVVKALLAIPAVATFADWLSPTSAHAHAHDAQKFPDTPEFHHKMAGIDTIRLLNTLQMIHLRSEGKYRPFSELGGIEPAQKFLDSERAKKMAQDHSKLKALNFSGPEILPGWRATLKLSAGRDRYTITFHDVSQYKVGDLSSDEVGRIYEGKLRGSGSGNEWSSARSVIDGVGIGAPPKQSKPTGIVGLLRGITAALVVPAYASHCGNPTECCCECVCCHSTPCRGCGHCQDQIPADLFGCANCGCTCCQWVCL